MQDLRSIREYIARDSSRSAKTFIHRIRERVRRIGVMPSAGVPVLEMPRPDLREIFIGNYRVLYRYDEKAVHVLTVIHGARQLRDAHIPTDDE